MIYIEHIQAEQNKCFTSAEQQNVQQAIIENDINRLENDVAVSDSTSLFQQFNPLRSFFNGLHTHNDHGMLHMHVWICSDSKLKTSCSFSVTSLLSVLRLYLEKFVFI